MPILIDSQEQAPWRFDCNTRHVDLPTGDYSLPGFEHNICVERKSLNDLVKTVIHDWARFARQLRRMAAMDVALIVVEAPASAVMGHQYLGDTNPNSVRGKLNKIHIHFGIPTLFLDTREIAAAWTRNLFDQFLADRGMPPLTAP